MEDSFHGRQLMEGGVLSGYGPLSNSLSLFLVQATIILGFCRFLGLFGSFLHQPKVIFEILAGILLGPSALGRYAPFTETIFPAASLPYLAIVANIGLLFYLFLVGLEMNPQLLMSNAQRASLISAFGIAIPFALGIAISRVMFDVLLAHDKGFENVSFVSFFVFIGTAMSITAFPVLARIMKESGLVYTKAGALTISAAAVDDAAAWCLLTLAISIANARDMPSAGFIFLCVLGFAAVLLLVVRPLFKRVVSFVEALHSPAMQSNLFALTFMLLFMCAWTTALLGVHAIFGAFLFGMCVPRQSRLFNDCISRIEEFVTTFTLPLYFALSGLQTDVTSIRTAEEGAITLLVVVCATAGKFLGAGGAAAASGLSLREASLVGALMNTRGLVELIVLNLGIQAHILNVRTFSVMVIMCLVTTFMTTPAVDCIFPRELRAHYSLKMQEEIDERRRQKRAKLLARNKVEEEKGAEEMKERGIDEEETETKREQESVFWSAEATHDRLAVVVLSDDLAETQSLLCALSFFSPLSLSARLAVTVVRLADPQRDSDRATINNVVNDLALLNEENRLVRVDEERTDFLAFASSSPSRVSSSLTGAVDTATASIALACRSLRATSNAFSIHGNPAEFPRCLLQVVERNACSLVLFPCRYLCAESEREREEEGEKDVYWRTLFAHTVRSVVNPVALVVPLPRCVCAERFHNTPATPHNALPHTDEESERERDDHDRYLRSDGEPARVGENERETRSDWPTLFSACCPSPRNAPPLPRTHSHTEATAERRVRGESTLLPLVPRARRRVVVVFSGTHIDTDLVALAVLRKFAQSSALDDFSVLLPRDAESMDERVRESLRLLCRAHPIAVRSSQYTLAQSDLLASECAEMDFDLLLCAYIHPCDGRCSSSHHELGALGEAVYRKGTSGTGGSPLMLVLYPNRPML